VDRRLLESIPDWLSIAIAVMNETVRAEQTQLPAKIKELHKQHTDLRGRRARLLEMAETGAAKPSDKLESERRSTPASLLDRIAELDNEIGQIDDKIKNAESKPVTEIELPD